MTNTTTTAQPETLRLAESLTRMDTFTDYQRQELDKAAAQLRNLHKALQFYADGDHFIKTDADAWDTVSGEPPNYWCDEAGTATVEDGTIARLALAGHPIKFEEDATPAQSAAPQVGAYAELVHDICKAVAELPDRNSPEDWPEAMLVTHDELAEIVRGALRASHGQAPAAAYSPLTLTEARDLTCMLAGAPWPDEMLPELQRLLTIYDGLRANNQRPVDPATLPRKVGKEVMRTGRLPTTAQQAPAGDEQKALAALRYYMTECSGAEPSISVFHRMVDEALEAAPAAGTVAEWQWVPVEPTPEMVLAYSLGEPRVLPAYVGAKEKADAAIAKRWKAMLAAAPTAQPAPAATPQADSQPAPEVDEDGERYRHLIETLDDQTHGKPTLGAAWDDDIGFWTKGSFFGLKDKASIDAAIDAERAALAQKEAPHGN